MTYSITLDINQTNDIVRDSLIQSYKDNLSDPYSPEILDGLEVVIEYYMKPSEYAEWFQNRGRDEQG